MSTTIVTTQITYKYLMSKTKSELADMVFWTLDMKDKEFKLFDTLLSKIVESLDDEDFSGAKKLIEEWDRNHQPIER